MNARFFALAFLAALNPKLFAVDLLLMESRRPRLMFLCFLAGGLSMCLAVGLLAVSAVGGDGGGLSAEATASAGLDLAVGVLLLVIGALLTTGRLHGRRRPPAAAGEPERGGWAQRILAKPRLGLAVLIGALAGTPGAAYIAALRELITGHSPAAEQVIAVVVFALIEFSLLIIPLVFLVARPTATRMQTQRAQNWLMGHARQLMAGVALFVGGYMCDQRPGPPAQLTSGYQSRRRWCEEGHLRRRGRSKADALGEHAAGRAYAEAAGEDPAVRDPDRARPAAQPSSSPAPGSGSSSALENLFAAFSGQLRDFSAPHKL